ncbi:MAG: GGDEF domain-containing protein [Butyrivibrio sp.]|nr:GGDEF domain-containing protein [Butyrivibrio sp.]
MKNSSFKKNLIGTLLVVAVLVLAQFLYYANLRFTIESNHSKVHDYVNKELSYEPENLEASAEYINDWIERSHFSNEDLGRLYERASLIYMQLGKDMTYYRYLGYALYYLEQSMDKDYTVNIYLDLANFHLNNYAYDSAKDMIDKAQSVQAFEDISDLQVKSYAFRMLAIMDIYDGNYDKAEEELLYSNEIVDQSNTNIYEEAYRGINNVYLSRVYIEKGQFPKASKILDDYKDSPFFEVSAYRKIMLRDFIIPYYQNKCFLEVARNYSDGEENVKEQIKTAQTTIEDFLIICQEEGYEKTALNTLLEMQKKYPSNNEYIKETMVNKMHGLYSTLFDQQNSSYASIINSQVNDSKAAMGEDVKLEIANRNKTELIVISILLVFVVISMGTSIILNSRYDALTQLFTRRVFNKNLEKSGRSTSEYAIIMIDIDDFKNINDTYGHICGDKVLQKLGSIISKETKQDCKAFRYGGEEFALILGKNTVKEAEIIAERIRRNMEMEKWDFDPNLSITISLGIAKGVGSNDVLKKADDNLYQAKRSGKNVVCAGEKE